MKNAKEIKEKEMKAAEAEMKKCKVSVLCISQSQANKCPINNHNGKISVKKSMK